MELHLVTPNRAPLELEVLEAVLPGAAGVFAIHPEHTPMLSTLGCGVLIAYLTDHSERHMAVHGGFAEFRDGRITVLADAFEPSERIDQARAEAARERAQNRLDKPDEQTDKNRAETALYRALARLHALSGEGY